MYTMAKQRLFYSRLDQIWLGVLFYVVKAFITVGPVAVDRPQVPVFSG
jgi:hypothetical protein